MLKMLRRIVQDVHAAHDFGDALEIMVQSIRDAMETQACSVFLIDPIHRVVHQVLSTNWRGIRCHLP